MIAGIGLKRLYLGTCADLSLFVNTTYKCFKQQEQIQDFVKGVLFKAIDE